MTWTDGKRHVASQKEVDAFALAKKRWACGFCGHNFVLGDVFRWVYTNDIPGAGGNPFICDVCDHGETRAELAERYRQLRLEFISEKFWSFSRAN